MIKIENLDKFRGKMKWTTVTEDGRVTISVGSKKYTGTIGHSPSNGYFVSINGYYNHEPFDLAGVEKASFMKSVLGYTDDDGDWPWMKSTDDILKVLAALDKLYVSKRPKSMEMEHLFIENTDFTPKKKHYSLNFQM